MDVNVSLPRPAIVAVAAFAVVLVLLLAWIGGEQHYRSCIEKAALEHPVPVGGAGAPGPSLAERRAAIAGCSRWP
jgi:hypothetical protein